MTLIEECRAAYPRGAWVETREHRCDNAHEGIAVDKESEDYAEGEPRLYWVSDLTGRILEDGCGETVRDALECFAEIACLANVGRTAIGERIRAGVTK